MNVQPQNIAQIHERGKKQLADIFNSTWNWFDCKTSCHFICPAYQHLDIPSNLEWSSIFFFSFQLTGSNLWFIWTLLFFLYIIFKQFSNNILYFFIYISMTHIHNTHISIVRWLQSRFERILLNLYLFNASSDVRDLCEKACIEKNWIWWRFTKFNCTTQTRLHT